MVWKVRTAWRRCQAVKYKLYQPCLFALPTLQVSLQCSATAVGNNFLWHRRSAANCAGIIRMRFQNNISKSSHKHMNDFHFIPYMHT